MREDQIDQAERLATLENDRKVLEQRGSTFHQHAQSQAAELSGGRFAAVGAPRVVGSTAGVASQYPAASAAHQTELPPEQPLGIDINAMPGDEPSAELSAVEQLGDLTSADAPSTTTSGDEEQRAGVRSPPLSKGSG
jgi:hypothetical protein